MKSSNTTAANEFRPDDTVLEQNKSIGIRLRIVDTNESD